MAAADAKQQAQEHVNDLRVRMEAFFRGEIDEATFRAEQRAAWTEIHRRPEFAGEVLSLIRQSLPVVPEVR
jgi:hypothetical protein